jgi:hypothetical protein
MLTPRQLRRTAGLSYLRERLARDHSPLGDDRHVPKHQDPLQL